MLFNEANQLVVDLCKAYEAKHGEMGKFLAYGALQSHLAFCLADDASDEVRLIVQTQMKEKLRDLLTEIISH